MQNGMIHRLSICCESYNYRNIVNNNCSCNEVLKIYHQVSSGFIRVYKGFYLVYVTSIFYAILFD